MATVYMETPDFRSNGSFMVSQKNVAWLGIALSNLATLCGIVASFCRFISFTQPFQTIQMIYTYGAWHPPQTTATLAWYSSQLVPSCQGWVCIFWKFACIFQVDDHTTHNNLTTNNSTTWVSTLYSKLTCYWVRDVQDRKRGYHVSMMTAVYVKCFQLICFCYAWEKVSFLKNK